MGPAPPTSAVSAERRARGAATEAVGRRARRGGPRRPADEPLPRRQPALAPQPRGGGGPVAVEPELFDFLAVCLRWSRDSDGAFDVTVGPLMKAWGFFRDEGRLPDEREIQAALARRGLPARRPRPRARHGRFDRPGVELDLGGIGKGYAVDRVVELLRRRGVALGARQPRRQQRLRPRRAAGARGVGGRHPGPDAHPAAEAETVRAARPGAQRLGRLRPLLREGRRHLLAHHGPENGAAGPGRAERRRRERERPPTATRSTTSSSCRGSDARARSSRGVPRRAGRSVLFFLPAAGSGLGGSSASGRQEPESGMLLHARGRRLRGRSWCRPRPQRAAPTLAGRRVWAHPRDAGTTEASVVAFVEQLAKAHVNTLVMEVKTSAGLFWPSERFAPAVVAEYRDVRLPGRAHPRVPQARRSPCTRGSSTSPRAPAPTSSQQHPEWLALSPEGKPTTAEVLRGPPLPAGLDVPGPSARATPTSGSSR